MRLLPLMALTSASQLLLDQVTNIGYTYRDSVRQRTMPESRRADNLFRYFYMSLWSPFFFELSFRLVEKYYTTPALTKLLELDKLGYRDLPLVLRNKMLGGLTQASSFKHVPDLLAHDKRLSDPHLVEHLRERLNFQSHLERLFPGDAKLVDDIQALVKTYGADVEREIKQYTKGHPYALTSLVDENITRPFELAALKDAESKIRGLATRAGRHPEFSKQASKNDIKALLIKGMKSQRVQRAIGQVKRSNNWPKMILALGINFVSYGVIANLLDIKVIQPWQDRMVAKRGTVKDVERPAFMALIPGVAIFGGLMYLLRNRGYINQLVLSGVTSLLAYTGIAWAGIQKALAKPPKSMQKTPTVPKQPLPQTQVQQPAAQNPWAVGRVPAAYTRTTF